MNEIKRSFDLLDKWVERNGWSGYDPYDIKGIKLFLILHKNNYTTFSLDLISNKFPRFSRKFFRVNKQVNAKAMALFARGYINLYKKCGDKQYLEKAIFCLKWLIEHPSQGYSGFCWGYPFDWQSRIFIPKGTPSGVVTSIAAHAFLDAYEIIGNKKYLTIAKGCCNFIMNDLNIDKINEDNICFSYTPIDNFHVHNANLFSASTLLRAYSYLKNEKFKEIGIKSINFTVSDQKKEGSFYYWASPDKIIGRIDNYHTGFILECLNICRRELGDSFNYTSKLKKGLAKMTPESGYPVDIHSCSQGIITFSELYDFDQSYLKLAKRIAEWTINNMLDDSGYFYYQVYKKNYLDKMPYMN